MLTYQRDACTWCDTHNTHDVMPMMCMTWCPWCAQCDAHVTSVILHHVVHVVGIISCALRVSHHVHCGCYIMCIAGITSCMSRASWASYCVRHMCASHRWGRQSGKISALEILAPQKNKCPRKCNLFWVRKVLEIFKSSDLLWHRIYWTFSILEYLWNSLNIPGIFPQYSAFEYFLFFSAQHWV